MKAIRLSFLLLFATAAVLCAQDGPRLLKRGVIIPERGEVTGYLLLTPRAQWSFIPPGGWQVNLDAANLRVQMIASNYAASLEMKIHWSEAGRVFNVDAASWRQQVLAEQAEAKILEEFPCYAVNQAGRGCDLEFVRDGKTRMARRRALVPFPGGALEFTLTAVKEKFAAQHLAYAGFLNSLEFNPGAAARAGR